MLYRKNWGGGVRVTHLGLLTHLPYPGSFTGQYSLGWKTLVLKPEDSDINCSLIR